ncbi:MAG: hypothetical protein H0Z33_04260 [Bacillaceae bacterium]|nr:hypothetical protein [Bacillaceae bacterium]
MAFRTNRRRGNWLRRGVGVISASIGITILVKTLPTWFWYAMIGAAMTIIGWYLFISQNFWR